MWLVFISQILAECQQNLGRLAPSQRPGNHDALPCSNLLVHVLGDSDRTSYGRILQICLKSCRTNLLWASTSLNSQLSCLLPILSCMSFIVVSSAKVCWWNIITPHVPDFLLPEDSKKKSKSMEIPISSRCPSLPKGGSAAASDRRRSLWARGLQGLKWGDPKAGWSSTGKSYKKSPCLHWNFIGVCAYLGIPIFIAGWFFSWKIRVENWWVWRLSHFGKPP